MPQSSSSAPSSAVLQQEFISAWEGELRPNIEAFLGRAREEIRDEVLLKLLVVEIRCRKSRGERVEPSEYTSRWPQHGDLIALAFREQTDTLTFESSTLTEAFIPRLIRDKDPLPAQIGRFLIRASLGAGSFGTVLLAYDPQLAREVALKVPRAGTILTALDAERFFREARAAAQLHHPNIVPVHEVGQADGTYFIVSELIRGRTLDEAMKQPMLRRDIVSIASRLARALDYAHRKGVVHRDIKPANIMLSGDTEPLIMDFGLARHEDAGALRTEEGVRMGTPAYMSPEQARGESHRADGRSDQWSLGVILYEMLVGSRPFAGASAQLLDAVLSADPRSPRAIDPTIPRDLNTIALKCLAKDPTNRYETCSDLADDLERWSRGEPILARPIKPLERLMRWAARKPAVAAMWFFLALTMAFGIGGGFSIWQWQSAVVARDDAETNREIADSARQRAETARQETRAALSGETAALVKEQQAKAQLAEVNQKLERIAYCDQIALAQRDYDAGDVGNAQKRLEACNAKYRNWEWQHLYEQYHDHELAVISMPAGGAYEVFFDTDGGIITRSGHSVRVYDILTRKLRGALFCRENEITSIAISANGERLVAGGHKSVYVWNPKTRQQVAKLAGRAPVAISPNGEQVVCAQDDHSLHLIDLKQGNAVTEFKGHTSFLTNLEYRPDGQRIVSASVDQPRREVEIRLWSVPEVRSLSTVKEKTIYLQKLEFTPDGHQFACAIGDSVRLIDGETGAQIHKLDGHKRSVLDFDFNSDGSQIASASHDGTVRLWSTSSGQPLATLAAVTDQLLCVEYSPDDRLLATAGLDRSIHIWDLPTQTRIAQFQGHTSVVNDLTFSHDGLRLASASLDKTARCWEIPSRAPVVTLDTQTKQATYAAFSPDGTKLVSTGDQGSVIVWDGLTGQLLATLRGHYGIVNHAAFAGNGQRFATAGWDGNVCFWDVPELRQHLFLSKHKGKALHVAFSPDGSQVASAGEDKSVRIWDSETGELRATLADHSSKVVHCAFSPKGDRLASTDYSRWFLWTADGTPISKRDEHTDMVQQVVFSPDSLRVATASDDRTVRLWDAMSGEPLAILTGHTGGVNHAAFNHDGSMLASGSEDGTIRLWDGRTGESLAELSGHLGAVSHLAFHPDGNRLVSCSSDSLRGGIRMAGAGKDYALRLWDISSGKQVAVLEGHTDMVYCVTFSPDGTRIASASADGTVRLWFPRLPAEAFELRKKTAAMLSAHVP